MAVQDGMSIIDRTAVTDFDIEKIAREPKFNPDVPPEKHGRASTYRNGKCGCSACQEASNNYRRYNYARKTGLPPGDPRHGTINGYSNFRCKCNLCEKARLARDAKARKTRKARKARTETQATS